MDPALGRFLGNDLLADLIPGISPSAYGFNNPLLFNDPTGLFPETDTLQAVVIRAPRENNTHFYGFSIWSSNPIERGIALKGQKGDKEWLREAFKKSNQTIHWGGYKGRTEWGEEFQRFSEYLSMGVTGSILAAVASPLLIEQLSSKSLTDATVELGTQVVSNMAIDGVGGLGKIDYADVVLAGLGMNTVTTTIVGATVDFDQSGLSNSFDGSKEITATLIDGTTGGFSIGQKSLLNKSNIETSTQVILEIWNNTKLDLLNKAAQKVGSDE